MTPALRSLAAALCGLLSLSALPALAAPGDVVINEIAWMGSDAAAGDEWIELYNNTDAAIDLAGWVIEDDKAVGGTSFRTYTLSGTIPAKGYFLIEKAETASSVTADLIVSTISLANSGDTLELIDGAAAVIDSVPCNTVGWFGGNSATPRSSMERVSPTADGTLAASWVTNDGITRNGTDSAGGAFNGTPGGFNSPLAPDTTPPTVAHIHSPSLKQVVVYFNEALDLNHAAMAMHYKVGGVAPQSAAIEAATPDMVTLTFAADLSGGAVAELAIDALPDAAGNAANGLTATFFPGLTPMSALQADDALGAPSIDPDAFLTVQGWVAAAGAFSIWETQLYDTTGGVTVFDDSLAGAAKMGELIIASGKINFFNGKTELGFGAGSVKAFVEATTNDLPVFVTTVDAYLADAEAYEGLLIGFRNLTLASGAWPASGSNANLVVSDGGAGTAVVRVDRDTDVDEGAEPTWPTNVVGVASQFDATEPYTDGFQVMPRAHADFGATLCDCAPDTMDQYWCTPTLGACTIVACAPGQADCDDDAANGCEQDTATDKNNCGACGNTCGATEGCVDSVCVVTCPDADSDGFLDAACGGDDCDDSDDTIRPDGTEVCGDSIDQDCSGADLVCEDTDKAPGGSGCGCASTEGSGALAGLFLFGLLGLRRRRR